MSSLGRDQTFLGGIEREDWWFTLPSELRRLDFGRSLQGTRVSYMVKIDNVIEFMCAGNDAMKTTITPEKASLFFRDDIMTNAFSAFVSKNTIWVASCGVGDILYVPANFIVYEHYVNKQDVYGLRMSVLVNPRSPITWQLIRARIVH